LGVPRLPKGGRQRTGQREFGRLGPVDIVPPDALELFRQEALGLSTQLSVTEVLRAIGLRLSAEGAPGADLHELGERVERARQLLSGVSEDLRVLVWLEAAPAGIARELLNNSEHYARHPEAWDLTLKRFGQALAGRFPRFAGVDFAEPLALYVEEYSKALRRVRRASGGSRSSRKWEALQALASRLRLHESGLRPENFKRTVMRAKATLRKPISPKLGDKR
jgi:hypothetical protein